MGSLLSKKSETPDLHESYANVKITNGRVWFHNEHRDPKSLCHKMNYYKPGNGDFPISYGGPMRTKEELEELRRTGRIRYDGGVGHIVSSELCGCGKHGADGEGQEDIPSIGSSLQDMKLNELVLEGDDDEPKYLTTMEIQWHRDSRGKFHYIPKQPRGNIGLIRDDQVNGLVSVGQEIHRIRANAQPLMISGFHLVENEPSIAETTVTRSETRIDEEVSRIG